MVTHIFIFFCFMLCQSSLLSIIISFVYKDKWCFDETMKITLTLFARITSSVQASFILQYVFPRVQSLKFGLKIGCYLCLKNL